MPKSSPSQAPIKKQEGSLQLQMFCQTLTSHQMLRESILEEENAPRGPELHVHQEIQVKVIRLEQQYSKQFIG
ncbi:hypothetical protein OUZ56_011358 [Daphnia magna]|uniref:Uncharacterized protein n=1 Tax=Daphnia magna TaxID=35525 RepID=A0ABQ9YZZ7_9CRUS|nr:hypothetical protein OUZ56_011358 [Daphnia magna]